MGLAEDVPLLQMTGITKTFPGVRALDGVDFTLAAGEVHALMGENGAGKSTLIKVLTGVYPRDAGSIRFGGGEIHPRSPLQAQHLGISTVYQEVNLIGDLSVAENVYLGRQPRRFGAIAWGEMRRRARQALSRLDLDLDVARPLSSYSIAIQQMVAIARALDVSARLLILDEPTSSLDRRETDRLFDVMRRLRGEGMGILFITHFLDQVYEVSDRITVLRNGRLVGQYAAGGLPRIELIAHMIGQEAEQVRAMTARRRRDRPAPRGEPLLAARGLGRRGAVEPFDLDIHAGEVLGLAGLLGSGRTETARLLFGLDRADGGTIRIGGREVVVKGPARAIACGLGFCPEDRKADGIIPDLSVRENIVLVVQSRRGWLRRLSRARQDEIAGRYIRALRIAPPDADRPMKFLSGGNQQKAILARWLAAEPRLLLLDEPTRGIDVGAKFEIARLVEQLCADGVAVVFISSELEEVVQSSHRVAVLRDRRKVGELSGEEISARRIMEVIAGG